MNIDRDIISSIAEINVEGNGGTIALVRAVQVKRNKKDTGDFLLVSLEDGIGHDDHIKLVTDLGKKEFVKRGSIIYCNLYMDRLYNRTEFNNDIVGIKTINNTEEDLNFVYSKIKTAKATREKFVNRIKNTTATCKSLVEAKRRMSQLKDGDNDRFAVFGFFRSKRESNKTFIIEIGDDTSSISALMWKDAAQYFFKEVNIDDFIKVNLDVDASISQGRLKAWCKIKSYVNYGKEKA